MVSEKELSDIDFEGFKKALMHIKNVNNSDNNVYLTVGSLIEINNITGSNNITPRKVNVKPHSCGKMYTDKDLIEYILYHFIDPVNKIKINWRDFYFELLDNIHPFYDGNETTCNIPYAGNFN